jgi:hypothetical protein
MRIRRIAISTGFAAGLAALPLASAEAQYYAPPCADPLAWPFCIAGAAIGAAATIATAPFWLLSGAPFYPYGYYPPYYPAPSYYAPPYPAYYAPSYAAYAPPPAQAPAVPAALTPPPPAVQNAYWYCPTSKGFYPNVASCPVAWRRLPLTPPKAKS